MKYKLRSLEGNMENKDENIEDVEDMGKYEDDSLNNTVIAQDEVGVKVVVTEDDENITKQDLLQHMKQLNELIDTQNETFKEEINHIRLYKPPFATGSKFSKGGVAIYAKDNLNTTKRDDLIEISDSFEAIWIEINMDKTKNIICGCVYRHPNTDISIFENYISKCLRQLIKKRNYVTSQVILTLTPVISIEIS